MLFNFPFFCRGPSIRGSLDQLPNDILVDGVLFHLDIKEILRMRRVRTRKRFLIIY
jgi:hypothetical protein